MAKQMYLVREVADILRVSVTKVRELIDKKQLHAIKIDKVYRIPHDALAAYMRERLQ